MNETKSTLHELAKVLRLPILRSYDEHVSNGASFEENLIRLLQVEVLERNLRGIARRTKAAGFPQLKTLDMFEFNRLPGLDPKVVKQLTTGDFVRQKTNVVGYGNSGMGKTHLMIAVGVEVIQRGYSVRFRKVADLIEELQEARTHNRLSQAMKTWEKVDLLCLDELGYLMLDQQASSLLFQLLSNRYEVKSTYLTTNFPFSKWVDFLGDKTLATALIDRFAHKTIFLNMNGDVSYRLDDGLNKTGSKR